MQTRRFYRFLAGDIVRVSARDGQEVVGKALDNLGFAGWATYRVLDSDGKVHAFNHNFDKAVLLYAEPPIAPEVIEFMMDRNSR